MIDADTASCGRDDCPYFSSSSKGNVKVGRCLLFDSATQGKRDPYNAIFLEGDCCRYGLKEGETIVPTPENILARLNKFPKDFLEELSLADIDPIIVPKERSLRN